MRRNLQRPRTWLQEMRMPGPERQAARAEREAERQMRRERDNEQSAERRAAALEAEARRYNSKHSDSGYTGGIPGL